MHTTTTPSYAKQTCRHPGTARLAVCTDTRPIASLRDRRGECGGHGRREGAFSLMEVMIALGIFAIGLVAVAAVFPTAISIQRETVRDLAGQRTIINARTMIQAMARSSELTPTSNFRTLTYEHDIDPTLRKGTLKAFTENIIPTLGRTGFPGGVQPMIDLPSPPINLPFAEMSTSLVQLNAAKSFHSLFSLDIRSYPQNISRADQRDYYWYPLIQARDLTSANPTWMIYLMVMQRRGSEAVPEVRFAQVDTRPSVTFDRFITFTTSSMDNDLDNDGLPDLIQPGDWVLGDDGSIHRVLLAEKHKITVESPIPVTGQLRLIYYAAAIDLAAPGILKRESRSPIVRIDQFEIVVDKP